MTKRRRLSRALALCVALLIVLPTSSFAAANIRGKIVRLGPYGDYPVAGIMVRVFRQDLGWSSPSYSGQDGMYYLYNIPPGSFQLCVGPQSSPCFIVQVPPQGWTDIAPIRI